MRYWKIEIKFPTQYESPTYYFEAKTKEVAEELACDITDDEASGVCSFYYDNQEGQEYFIENTTFNLVEVSYEEAKGHI